jgi:formylglycine-generating enzyme required for sulfatase activity
VPLPSGFGVDATEVTRGQYTAWLATSPSIAAEQGTCSLNTSYLPDATCMAKPSVCQGAACATHPQPCIDMCDAAAYCRALGRRLCADADWTTACSAAGAYTRPPGASPVGAGSLCNDYTAGAMTTVPVASKQGCQLPADSGYAGVFDMIGNLEEWAENCINSTGSAFADICKPRGLPFGQGAAAPFCNQSTYAERGAFRDNLGFRCCTR